MKRVKKISDENLLMIVLAFLAFSIGIWGNYRQLWLEDVGFTLIGISKLFSVALICSAIISFIISLFSYKIKIKDIVLLSILMRSISMVILLFTSNMFIIKTMMLLCIMCEVIFAIAFYPLLTYITKTDESYRKKTLIEYFARDIGIVSCGLLIGVSLGKFVFNYDTCLLISTFASLLSMVFLAMFNHKEKHKKVESLTKSFKELLSNKINKVFLTNQLIINISYGIVFDLMMLILTNYINFEVSLASVFIIVCNVLGSIFASIFSKYGKNLSISVSSIIKFGTRSLGYFVAFTMNNITSFIIAIVVAYISSRILEDKVTGKFLQIIDEENQFLYGNIRYFVACIGEGIGTFLAGVLIGYSFRVLFLGAAIVTLIQTIILIYLGKLSKNC
ncbi:MAG: MFS transporter [Bacilli bacterium]|nr:MFS transporter [Bacilli bacterium]